VALQLLQEAEGSAQPATSDPTAELELARRLSEIGLAQVDLGNEDEAVTALLRARALYGELSPAMTPERADVLVGLGRARIAQHRASEALEPLEQADAFWRDFDVGSRWAKEAALWLGRCYESLGRREDARQALARAGH
jgi:tetratricopeptide (TPR) repeat protein